MKILHIPYTYHPDPVGGTELYVEQLIHALRAQNIQSVIAAPGAAAETYTHDGTIVHRIPTADRVADVTELYGPGDTDAANFVGALLEREHIDLLHLHALTRIVSPRIAEQAHRRNLPVVFTYHTPTVSCVRGDLMLWGQSACDGILETDRCTRCRLHSLGMPKTAAAITMHAPQFVRARLQNHQGGIWTALRMRDLIRAQHTTFKMMMHADAIIAQSQWTKTLLIENQVAAEKIFLIPHGLPPPPPSRPRQHNATEVIRLIALGRLDAAKGMDLPITAMQQLPDLLLRLDVYGIVQNEADSAFAHKLMQSVARDTRIQLKPALPHSQIMSVLQEYDALLVPSRGLETGPLVVLEAFAAGIPVIGSKVGGIAEKVKHEIDGLLVPPTQAGWRAALHRIGTDRALLETLRANVCPPRSMQNVADEMYGVYRTVQTARRTQSA